MRSLLCIVRHVGQSSYHASLVVGAIRVDRHCQSSPPLGAHLDDSYCPRYPVTDSIASYSPVGSVHLPRVVPQVLELERPFAPGEPADDGEQPPRPAPLRPERAVRRGVVLAEAAPIIATETDVRHGWVLSGPIDGRTDGPAVDEVKNATTHERITSANGLIQLMSFTHC